MPLSCHEATDRLTQIQLLKKQFESSYRTAQSTNSREDWHTAQSLKHQLVSAMKELENNLGLNYESQEQELKELFGHNFLGIKEIESAFTLQNNEQLMSFTEDQQEQATTLLQEKLNEPDVAQLIQKIRTQEIPRDTFMLVLRRGQFADGTPVTMQSLQQKLEPTMQSQNQGKLILNPQPNQPYFTTPDPAIISKDNMEWILITKEVVPATLGKDNTQQARELAQEARRLGLITPRRSKGWEVVFDFVTMLRTHNIRLFTDPYCYDRTSDKTSDGGPVLVGGSFSVGLLVSVWAGAYSGFGSRLSR